MEKSLYEKVLEGREHPMFETDEEAEAHFRGELEKIASRRGKTVSELFEEIEHSPTWCEEDEEFHWMYCIWSAFKDSSEDV